MFQRLILVSLSLSAACAARSGIGAPPAEAGVRYRIELVDPRLPRLHLSVELPGDADGQSELALDDGWGGVTGAGADLELVEARTLDGQPLESHRESPSSWIVRHAPGASLVATFALGPTEHRGRLGGSEHYLPIVEPGLVHLIGANAWPTPRHLDQAAARAIELEWCGFEEAGWSVLSSFGAGPGARRLELPLDRFRHALFLAGELHLLSRPIRGSELLVAVYGDDWATPLEDFADLSAEIVAAERGFFDDFDQPCYLISLIPIGASQPGSDFLGGTGLTNSFALFLLPGATLSLERASGLSLSWLLAHEMFHAWNGNTIRLAEPEKLAYWFSEGFTDFYARRLLHGAGFLTDEEYVDSWNERLRAYASNPARNAPAQRIQEAFWSDRDVGRLPYERGDLVALLVDHSIRTVSAGARSLDDLMRELVRRALDGQGSMSNEDLLEAIAEASDAATAAAVRCIVVDGADVELAPDAAGPGLLLVPIDVPVFELGFDQERTIEAGAIIDLLPGSAAERAGLREGLALSGWSVTFGRTDVPVRLQVGQGGEQREISFLPVGDTVRGYRLERAAED